ncbi:MAG: hypothetical protein IPO05_08330 [Flavobacteriales bacterium]|jgi:hypothetical protein|nr:hypothetical protein [Flavobacteriales bacterium]HOZ39730.1 hypothetical protein [Flavobacteriales bacterium]
MIRSTFLFLLLGTTATHGQMVLIAPGTEDPGELRFNPTFIARNHIAAMVGERLIKRDDRPMSPQREKHMYRFDGEGRTTYANHSYGQPGSGRDTTSVAVTFDAQGRELERLRNDLTGHFSLRILRDTQGRPVRQTYARVANLGTDRYALIPGEVTAISDEHYRHEHVNDSTTRQVFINELGLPYREQLRIQDHLGYLHIIEDRYLISNRSSRITFRYDEQGRLSERVEQPDIAQPRMSRRTWTYDSAGNVRSGTLWHDDEHVQQDEYVYEDSTLLLRGRLTKDIKSGIIHVVRYTTEFR